MGILRGSNFESNQALVVSYHPDKTQVDRDSVLKLEAGNRNILDECIPKMGTWRDSNFESNQALVVSYHLVKFQID